MSFRVPKFKGIFKEIIEEKYYKEFPDRGINFEGVSSELFMDSIIRTSNALGHLLMKMDWSLLVAPKGSHFITSDNPVVVRNPDDLDWFYCGFASSPNNQATFPINPGICLFGSWGRVRRVIENISDKVVAEINLETFKCSNNFLFSSSNCLQRDILLLNKLVNEGYIKQKTYHQP